MTFMNDHDNIGAPQIEDQRMKEAIQRKKRDLTDRALIEADPDVYGSLVRLRGLRENNGGLTEEQENEMFMCIGRITELQTEGKIPDNKALETRARLELGILKQ